MNNDFDSDIRILLENEPRYTKEAYRFTADAVNYTVSKLDAHRHVTALELLKGARAFARSQYGAVSDLVLDSWGIKTASDMGKVVYLLISIGLLSASDDDNIEDFDIEFSFAAVPKEDAGI